MAPQTRRLARIANEAALLTRRLKAMVESVQHLELDSIALYKMEGVKGQGEIQTGELDFLGEQMVSKATKGLPH